MVEAHGVRDQLLGTLRCPACGGEFDPSSPDGASELRCQRCGRPVPVRSGIPRLVRDAALSAAAAGTRASFGYEWTHFADWRPSGETNFADYFAGLDLDSLAGRLVLDAGCGMGRHARQVAPFAAGVLALDFSDAIDAAARNVADRPNVQCAQADLTELPVADEAFDFVYSMGVLHHIGDTEGTLRRLVAALKPGGRLRVYLYWKRRGAVGLALAAVTLGRRVTTRLPFPLLRGLCWALSVLLAACVVGPYKALRRAGITVSDRWPLAVYAKYPFNVLYNDQFDRFSAPIEKRYSAGEVRALLESVGLRQIEVRPRFGWIADGVK